MAATSKSPTSVQAHSSRRPSAARGLQSPPHLSLSGTVDQEQFVSSDIIPHSKIVDDSAAGTDVQLESIGGSTKKPAWNKPSNEAAAVALEVGAAVMGAESWPALSDSARASPKSSPVLSNGSIVTSEGILAGSLSPPKEPDISISTPSHVAPSGQRSTKRGGDSPNHNRMAANGSLSRAPHMVGAFAGAQQHNTGNSGGSAREYSKEDTHRVSGQRGRSFGGNELHSQHGSFRSNNGPQARTDGSYHHKNGARRDSHRRESFTSQKRDGSRPFVRGPAPNGPNMPPPPPPVVMRPVVNPMVYHEVPHVYFVHSPYLDSPRPMPMVSYSPMLFPPTDPHLPTKILNQIDYYFSNENLVRDTFLRGYMDNEGWISIKLIAGFKKVMELTDNIHLILDAIQASNVVELQGDRVRRRSDWFKWLMPPNVTNRSIHDSSQDNLAAHLNRVALH